MRRFRLRGFLSTALAVISATLPLALAAPAAEDEDLARMDLEDLMNLEVTTVSKRSTKVSESPAAVSVISAEDIRRSGATTVPELLRAVPGVHVARIDASRWALSARGFDNEFSNKLLVMIDGRSIYTPLFSGVIWNEHELMLEDVERIEVVRGPGGTVWGANAVNGVINIITKKADDTQGLLVSSLAGDQETYTGAARWGGSAGDDLHYRVYGKFADRDDFESPGGGSANDAWRNVRAGGRIDWKLGESDLITLQGDFLDSNADRTLLSGSEDESEATGGNVLARYSHTFSATSDLSLQLYYHRIEREAASFIEDRDTADVEFQHSFAPLARNQFMWGAGYRITADRISGSPTFRFEGRSQKDHLASFFVQDEIALMPDLLSLTLGSKFEHNDYTGFEYQPSGRLMLTPHPRHSFWAAVSRAVRTPSRSDEDLFFSFDLSSSPLIDRADFRGSSEFDAEKVLAYELGYRAQPFDALSFDVAGFYNEYDDLSASVLTSTEFDFTTGEVVGNFVTDNQRKGKGYGAELATSWAVNDYVHLFGNYTFTRTDITDKTGPEPTGSTDSVENRTPRNRVRLASRFSLPWDFEFDAALSWVERLPGTPIDAYTRLDLRLGWRPLENLELSLVGLNLIEEHQEFPNSGLTAASEVPRSVYGRVQWRFR